MLDAKPEVLGISISYSPDLEDPGGCWRHAQLHKFVQLLRLAQTEGVYRPEPLVPLQVEPSREVYHNYFVDWMLNG